MATSDSSEEEGDFSDQLSVRAKLITVIVIKVNKQNPAEHENNNQWRHQSIPTK